MMIKMYYKDGHVKQIDNVISVEEAAEHILVISEVEGKHSYLKTPLHNVQMLSIWNMK